jgi:hypothetical protein
LQTGVTQQWVAPAGVTSIKLLVVAGEAAKLKTVGQMARPSDVRCIHLDPDSWAIWLKK